MAVQYISWEEARSLVLARLRELALRAGPVERTLKVIWDRYVLSMDDMIREVELNSELGRKIVAGELRKISYETGIEYVIRG